jgi:hypothetical protein
MGLFASLSVKKDTPTPRQFFEECENTRLRGYGTWKNIRNLIGRGTNLPHPSVPMKAVRKSLAGKELSVFLSCRGCAEVNEKTEVRWHECLNVARLKV